MPFLFDRKKRWKDLEVVKNTDLNAEIDNIINEAGLDQLSGWSQSVSQMQVQTNPGTLGSESLSTSSSDEVERLRYQLAAITGNSYWYQQPSLSLVEVESQLFSVTKNKIISGKIRSTSNQPIFLHADGAAQKVTLKATSTNLVLKIGGTTYTFNTDTDLTGLSAAPGTNNTAVVNNSLSTHDASTQYCGESDNTLTTLTLNTCGSNFTSKVGTFQAFKVVDGASTEYFIGYIQSASTGAAGVLTKCFRGYFFNSSDAPVKALKLTDADTVTLLKIHYIFAKTDLSLASTDNAPFYSASTPTSPSNGDYWFDLSNDSWKIYNGSSFVAANAHLIGIAVSDSSAVIATRSFEFFAAYKETNRIYLEKFDNNTLQSTVVGQSISVAGNDFFFDQNLSQFVMPANLTDSDGSTVEASSTTYYAYISETGNSILSTLKPTSRNFDLYGRYHRYNTWRFVAQIDNDGSSNFDSTTLLNQGEMRPQFLGDQSITSTHIKAQGITGDRLLNGTVTSTQIASQGVNQDRLQARASGTTVAAGGVAISSSCGSFSSTSGSQTQITNMTVTITTTGRPVRICLQNDASGADAYILSDASSGVASNAVLIIKRGGVVVTEDDVRVNGGTATGASVRVPLSTIGFIDMATNASAGTYTYGAFVSTDNHVSVVNGVLMAYEI